MGRRRKDQASQDVVEAVEPSAVDAAEIEVAVEAEVSPAVVAEPEVAPVVAPRKWKVLEDRTVSLFGQMTLLPAGTLVTAASYGNSGIKRMMEQGVQLEPVA